MVLYEKIMNFKGSVESKKLPTQQVKDEQPKSLKAYMVKQIISFEPEQDIWHAIQIMIKKGVSGGPVLDKQQRLVGMLSEKDCLRVLLDTAYNNHPHEKDKVKSYMSQNPQTMSLDKDIFHVAQAFLNSTFKRFPVVDRDGKLCGQISRRDIIKAAQKLRGTRW